MTSDQLWTWILIAGGIAPLGGVVAWLAGLIRHHVGRSTDGPSNTIALAAGVFLGVELTRALGRLQARAGMDATVDAMLPLVVGLGAASFLAGSHRRRRAGWLIVGLAAPWTLLAAVDVTELAGGADLAPFTTVAWLLAGAVPLLVGIVLARLDEHLEPDAFAAAGRPGSRRPGSLTAALARSTRYGPVGPGLVLAMLVTAAVTVFGARLPIVVQVALVVVGVLAGVELELRAIPPAVRRAMEAYHWIGRGAVARLERLSGRPMPRSRPAMARWLEAPETDADRAFRPELLTYLGRTDEAREVLARLEPATATERFHQATAAWELEWRLRRPILEPDFAALAAAIGPEGDPERLLAEGLEAWRRSEVTLAALDPGWMAHLVAFQERVGRQATGLVRAHERRQLLWLGALASGALFLAGRLLPA